MTYIQTIEKPARTIKKPTNTHNLLVLMFIILLRLHVTCTDARRSWKLRLTAHALETTTARVCAGMPLAQTHAEAGSCV
jgi:hypothetical protein